MTNRVRTRFAPSPTGYMHIGNLRTALYGYLFAKANKGDFLLRIEDTDQKRYVDDAVEFIQNTLKAANIIPNEGPDIGGDCGPYIQSQRMDIYKKYAEELIESGHAYRCFCNDCSEEQHSMQEAGDAKSFGGYNRACRDLDQSVIDQYLAEGRPYVIRQKMPLDGEVTFHDVVHGNITIACDTLEDQVILKRDGMPTYNFANVIDDHLMNISHVFRGTEFITSTPKHVLLYQYFGWEPPVFIHLPPVMGKNPDGSISKLSKRHGATGFSQLVDMGFLPEAITNYVALLGWSPKSEQELFSMEDLMNKFSLDGLSKSPAVFDYNKLDWFNSEYFKAMDAAEFARESKAFGGIIAETLGEKWEYLALLLQTRIHRFNEIPDQIGFFKELPSYDIDLYNNKRNKVTPEKAAEIIPLAIDIINKIEKWTPEGIDDILQPAIADSGIKMGTFMWPIRIALSGQKVTPGGVTELLYLLGKDESIHRLNCGLDKIK
ncbi:MAG: glutamate--tRNA ligase [Anaerovibrio sp.]|uniref:glutamate--tRNA ligase n=1 Tax=Anaerovibrio sp. TaxID=1872532 RepID=UPI0025D95A1E|nr:glutamate--tRNA ligase [Anaerovibrio sp.]MCR5176615.1 glutamate--tRNA ligase [Anaerovibrio sp.]